MATFVLNSSKGLFAMRLDVKVLLVLFFLSCGLESIAQCNCNFTIPAGTGIYTFDGAAKGAKPGDVICLAAGVRERINFNNLTGSSTNYITIINCGGQTLVGGPNANNAITITQSRYFRITGTGDPAYEYGIKITETKSGQGIVGGGKSSDMTFDHLEIAKASYAGIMAKTDPSTNCNDKTAERPHFVMYNVHIHHNYIHDTATGEGLYIGNSFYNGTTTYCGSTQYPHELRGVSIHDNIFSSCGRESIQVGAGVADVEIYNNKIYNYGAAGLTSQNGAIQVGLGTAAKVYNNFIKGGAASGPAFRVQGIGKIFIFNNVIVNPVRAIQLGVIATPLTTDIVSQGFVGPVGIFNNTIVNSSPDDVVVNESTAGPAGNVIYNNLVVGGQSNWLKLRGDTDWKKSNNLYIASVNDAKFVNPGLDDYRLLSGSPAINTGLDLTSYITANSIHKLDSLMYDAGKVSRPSGGGWDVGAYELSGNQKPSVSVGANQTLTLPTNSTTLAGSATDADGSIVSYLWTKQSGPGATLTNQTTTTLSVANLVEGVYVFRLTATDNGGETGFKDVTITVVDPNVNQPPVANAGGNKSITLPINTTVLTGSASDADGSIASYLWAKISGPTTFTMANQTTSTLTLSGLVQGVYVFRLTATDDDGDTDTDDATVTVNPAATNQLPTANAGPNKNLVLPTNSTSLAGSGSDPDGSIATYAWTKQSGPATGTLTNQNTPTLQLTNLVVGTYVFRLTVTDNVGATAFAQATVNVTADNQAPIANAGGNKTIQLPTNSTTLTGSGSDSDGSISSYLWTKLSGPAATLTNINSNVLSLAGLVQGTYVFQLTVTDNNGATGSATMTLSVQAANVAPIANAGSAKTITLPVNSTTLNGSGTDSDGSISTYLWEKLSGGAATLSGSSTPTLSLTNLAVGSYIFRLTVTDNNGATGSSQTNVTVLPLATNQSPLVNAGSDITLTLPLNSANIAGVANDPDGTITSYLWSKVSGPAATLSGTTLPTLSITNLVAGSYVFRLTATDNQGASASDDMNLVVTNVNQPPTVVASNDVVITLPTSSTSLAATASDPDGTVTNYLWINLSGPSAPTLISATTSIVSISGLVAGTYVFKVTVTDNDGATASDQVNVIVQTSTNINPIANAGSDVTIFLPTNSVTLTGSGTDADGTIITYGWTQVDGVAATLTNANTKTVSISGLAAGTYTFRLTVTDNSGGTGINDVNVTVNLSSTNQSPVADAGPDIALTLPNNSTNLIGSGSDPDGTISSYNWIKLSGPNATLSNENTAVLSLQDLVAGVYVFRLTVTDNNGSMASNNIQVTVFPASVNQSPVVSAGVNITITLPTNTTTLTGVASDPDGSIAAYTWTKQIGPTVTLSGEGTSNLVLTDLVVGTYIFRITVSDNSGATSFDEIIVSVLAQGSNVPPVVNAGIDKIIFLPTNSINLVGQASDADGTITTYQWSKISGPTSTVTGQNSPTLSISNMVPGQYTYRLTATDNLGATAFDEATIILFPGTVNQAPIANAGSNQTIVLPNSLTSLNGSGFDTDGSIVAYNWTQVSGPSCTLSNINSPTLFVDNLTIGVFQFQLTVQDNEGATGSSIATVTVVAEGSNQPPIANAGFDQIINLPQNGTEIQGSGFDADGTITAYAWVKKSGPAALTLSGQSTSKLTVSDMVAGTYQFTLTVTDNEGLTNSDDVKVNVIPATVNQNPAVDAGADISIRLPVNNVTLTATATDIDGSISAILWTEVSGPAAATLANQTTNTLSVTNLVMGTYVFQVEATDNNGATATDDVSVRVIQEGVNALPVVMTGSPKIIALPTTSTTLSGSASDSDGTIQQVLWALQSGPGTPLLSGETTTTLNVQNLVQGLYTFRLTATDDEGATAFAETTVEVKAARAPTVVFAGNDTTLVLPNNFMPLMGEVTPGDGVIIVDYRWEQTDGEPVNIAGEEPELVLVNLVPGSYAFRLTVTDDIGMVVSDEINVIVIEGKSNPIGAPLLLTPNADGINDLWLVKNVSMIEGCPLRIFNSLGKAVYTAEQYQNDWDGLMSNTGQSLKEGDYYFIFDCGNKKRYSGAFRLMR